MSRTGVQGANRLASNSLLEGLVCAERVARDIVTARALSSLPRARSLDVPLLRGRGVAQGVADLCCEVMWRDAGRIRTAAVLLRARNRLHDIEKRLPVGATEETNLVQTAQLIVEGALRRKESRGGHFRTDYPRAKRAWAKKHVEL